MNIYNYYDYSTISTPFPASAPDGKPKMPQCHIYMKMRPVGLRASSSCKQREGSG